MIIFGFYGRIFFRVSYLINSRQPQRKIRLKNPAKAKTEEGIKP